MSQGFRCTLGLQEQLFCPHRPCIQLGGELGTNRKKCHVGKVQGAMAGILEISATDQLWTLG